MTRYFFDCYCNGSLHRDPYGADLDHDEVADQAFAVVLELMKETGLTRERSEITVKVRDDDSQEIYTLDGRLAGAFTTDDGGIRPTHLR